MEHTPFTEEELWITRDTLKGWGWEGKTLEHALIVANEVIRDSSHDQAPYKLSLDVIKTLLDMVREHPSGWIKAKRPSIGVLARALMNAQKEQ